MNGLMKIAFLIFLIVGGAYLSGVRIHPEALNASVPGGGSHKSVELLFKDGQRATGQIVKETPDGILFNMDGAEVSFTNAEIVSRAEVSVPSAGSVKRGNKSGEAFITYDPSISIFNQIAGKDPEKKPVFQASSLWGSKPRGAVQSSGGPSVKSDANSLVGIYNKSMSKESLDAWKNDTLAQMGQGRNPFVEARNAAQAKAAAADTSRSEAKLKKLEENG